MSTSILTNQGHSVNNDMNNCLNCCFMSPALILKHTSDDIEISWTHLQIYTLKRHKKG